MHIGFDGKRDWEVTQEDSFHEGIEFAGELPSFTSGDVVIDFTPLISDTKGLLSGLQRSFVRERIHRSDRTATRGTERPQT